MAKGHAGKASPRDTWRTAQFTSKIGLHKTAQSKMKIQQFQFPGQVAAYLVSPKAPFPFQKWLALQYSHTDTFHYKNVCISPAHDLQQKEPAFMPQQSFLTQWAGVQCHYPDMGKTIPSSL